MAAVTMYALLSPWTFCAVTTILLYNFNRTFHFFSKVVFYYFSMFAICTLAIPIVMWRPGNVLNVNILSRMTTCSFAFLYGIKWEFVGREYLSDPTPGVVVGNHQSVIDVLGMMVVWPHLKRCVSMVKTELRYALSFGAICYFCGTVFIDRVNPAKARETISNTVDYLKKKRTKVYVFPEGTRNGGPDLLPFKKGAFHLAVQGQMPIFPVVFSDYSHVYSYEKRIFEPGRITVTVLPPVSTVGLTSADVTELSLRVRKQMLDVLQAAVPKTEAVGVGDK